jgi:hypothetical protein
LLINTGGASRIVNLSVSSTLAIVSGSTAGLNFQSGSRMTIGSGGVVLLSGSASNQGGISVQQSNSLITIDGGLLSHTTTGGVSALFQSGGSLVINSGTFLRNTGSSANAGTSLGKDSSLTMNGGRYAADSNLSVGQSTGSGTTRLTVNAGVLQLTTGSSASSANVFNVGESTASGSGTYIATIGGTAGSPLVSISNVTNNATLSVGNRTNLLGNSQLRLLSGTITTNNLLLTNNSTFTFNKGELAARTITATNGQVFTVGSGTESATLKMLLANGAASTGTFGSGLSIASLANLVTAAGTTTLTATSGGLANAGTILPGGDGVLGRLSITGSIGLASTSLLSLDVSGTGAGLFDTFAASSSLLFGGTLSLNAISGFSFEAGQSFKLFDFASGQASGGFTAISAPSDPLVTFDTSQLLTTGVITVLAVPEPTAVALAVVGGCAALTAGRWRGRRRWRSLERSA